VRLSIALLLVSGCGSSPHGFSDPVETSPPAPVSPASPPPVSRTNEAADAGPALTSVTLPFKPSNVNVEALGAQELFDVRIAGVCGAKEDRAQLETRGHPNGGREKTKPGSCSSRFERPPRLSRERDTRRL
jgi:hypothetical protein